MVLLNVLVKAAEIRSIDTHTSRAVVWILTSFCRFKSEVPLTIAADGQKIIEAGS